MAQKNLKTWGAGDPNYADTMRKLKPTVKPMPIRPDNSYIDPTYSPNSGNAPIDPGFAKKVSKKKLKEIKKEIIKRR